MTALMTPGFALFLSPQSITLRARSGGGGWQDVGSTPFDVPDLPGAIAALRGKAQDGAQDLHVAVVLPQAVVRYLSIVTGDAGEAERRAEAEKALEGATPYAVADLAFDISADGAQTHIAAAARETLAEAEEFARSHGFVPVCFTADAEGTHFQQPPVFDQGAAEAAEPLLAETKEDASPAETAAAAPEPLEPAAPADAGPEVEPEVETRPEAETETETEAEAEAEKETAQEAAVSKAAAAPAEPSVAEGRDPAPGPAGEAPAIPPAPPAPAAEAGAAAAPSAESAASASGTAQEAAGVGKTAVNPSADHPAAEDEDRSGPGAAPGFATRRGKAAKPPAQAPSQPERPHKAAAAQTIPPAPEPSAPPAPAVKAPAAIPPAPGPSAPAALAAAARGVTPPAPAKPVSPAAATPVAPPAAVSSAKLLQSPSAKPAREAAHAGPGAHVRRFGRLPAYSLPAALRSLPPARRRMLSAVAALAVTGAAAIAVFSASGPEEPAARAIAPAAEQDQTAQAGPELPGAGEAEAAIAPQVGVLADLPDPGLQETGEAADGGEALAPQDGELAFETGAEEPGGPDAPEAASGPEDPEQLARFRAAQYAATGIWQSPPGIAAPAAPAGPEAGTDGIFVASIDNGELSQDAVALPPAESFAADTAPDPRASPAAPGATFELDARGLVKATPGGTLNPDGVMVYLGRPGKVPPQTPARPDPAAEAAAEAAAREQVLSQKRPRLRPENLAETAERAQLGGLSRAELAAVRPRLRPASLKPANEDRLPATAQAVRSSQVPRARPANFANLVDRARRNGANTAAAARAAAVPAAAAAPAPRIPSSASVARRATTGNAINLRKLNLIGVYGTPSDRRALVRLPSGRYKKVKVGDRLDGGRVVAIGESRLQYQKSGRSRTLEMPDS